MTDERQAGLREALTQANLVEQAEEAIEGGYRHMEVEPDLLLRVIRRALAAPAQEEGLDEVWAEVEATRPDDRLMMFRSGSEDPDKAYCAKFTLTGKAEGYYYGPTPIAALRALRALGPKGEPSSPAPTPSRE